MSRLIVLGLVAVAGSAMVGVTSSASLAQQSRPLRQSSTCTYANRADDNGPPPTYVCPGFDKTAHDPRLSWEAAFNAVMKTPPCANPLKGAETDEALMKSTFEILERRNIIAVTSGPVLERWRSAGNERIIPSAMFNFSPTAPSIATLRDGFAAKRYAVFGEVGIQYQGVSPSDPRFEPYLAVAEAADVPLGIHVGIGPPGAPSCKVLATIAHGCIARSSLKRPSSATPSCASTSCTRAGRCSTISWPCSGPIRKSMSTSARFASPYRARSLTTTSNGSSTPVLAAG